MPPKRKMTIQDDAVPAAAEAAETVTDMAETVIATTATSVKPTTTTQGMEKTMKTAEDFLAFGQSNMDAFVKSSQIWAAGVQDLSKQIAASAQASFDETMATFKAMSTVKSPKDALDMQASLVRTNLEKAVAETGKITDASMKLAEQAFAPITAQMTAAAEKFAKVA